MTILRYITQYELAEYKRNGWKCSFYGQRGDGLHCFIAAFQCCEAR